MVHLVHGAMTKGYFNLDLLWLLEGPDPQKGFRFLAKKQNISGAWIPLRIQA